MLTVSRFGPFNFAETAPAIRYIGRWMDLKNSGLDAVAKYMSVYVTVYMSVFVSVYMSVYASVYVSVFMSVVPLGNTTPVQVVAIQFANLDIPVAPDRAVRRKQ